MLHGSSSLPTRVRGFLTTYGTWGGKLGRIIHRIWKGRFCKLVLVCAYVSDHLIFGFRSSCDRAEFILTLVMTWAPVLILTGTCSPFAAARAVLTPS
jgi:hypothetical protein